MDVIVMCRTQYGKLLFLENDDGIIEFDSFEEAEKAADDHPLFSLMDYQPIRVEV